jgi:hypothetical protein
MALSSSHHHQMDGQTEVLNALIEQMLRAYVASDCASWARWLSEASRAYNSSVHSSTGYSPDFLLMGYHPRGASAFLVPAPTQPRGLFYRAKRLSTSPLWNNTDNPCTMLWCLHRNVKFEPTIKGGDLLRNYDQETLLWSTLTF